MNEVKGIISCIGKKEKVTNSVLIKGDDKKEFSAYSIVILVLLFSLSLSLSLPRCSVFLKKLPFSLLLLQGLVL